MPSPRFALVALPGGRCLSRVLLAGWAGAPGRALIPWLGSALLARAVERVAFAVLQLGVLLFVAEVLVACVHHRATSSPMSTATAAARRSASTCWAVTRPRLSTMSSRAATASHASRSVNARTFVDDDVLTMGGLPGLGIHG